MARPGRERSETSASLRDVVGRCSLGGQLERARVRSYRATRLSHFFEDGRLLHAGHHQFLKGLGFLHLKLGPTEQHIRVLTGRIRPLWLGRDGPTRAKPRERDKKER